MLPRLTQAQASLTREVQVINEHGVQDTISIPAERPLTVYVDKRELVTLMTLGAHPEWLVLGYLRNQRLVSSADEIESITVDWDAETMVPVSPPSKPDTELTICKRAPNTVW
jgi:FdhD protein